MRRWLEHASQLAIGGCLVMPVGAEDSSQVLVKVTRQSETEFHQESLMNVQFVPLVGEQGWRERGRLLRSSAKSSVVATIAELLREVAEPIADIESAPIHAARSARSKAQLPS